MINKTGNKIFILNLFWMILYFNALKIYFNVSDAWIVQS